jgi:hypothetical protein
MSAPTTATPPSPARKEFESAVNIFSLLIAAAFILKIVFQLIQKLKTEDRANTVPTIENPLGSNPSKAGGQADATIGMYGWSGFWLICLMVTIISILMRRYKSSTNVSTTLNVLFYSMPFVMAIALVVWTVIQTYTYRHKINMNQIPSSYMTWSIVSTVNLMLMFGVIYALCSKLLTCKTISPGDKNESILILLAWTSLILGMLTSGVLLVSHVLVACYTTDG